MQLSDIITDVRDRTQQPDTTYLPDAKITTYINRALDDISEVAEYEKGPITMSSVAGQQAYTLPTDCLTDGLRRITQLYGDGSMVPLEYLSRDDFDEMSMIPQAAELGVQVGARYYTVWGNKFYLLPIPQANGNNDLTLYYYGMLPYVANNTDTPAIPANRHELLVLFASARVMRYTGDAQGEADFLQEYQAQKQLFSEEVARNNRDGPRQVRDVWYSW